MTLSQLFETSLGRRAPWQKNSGNNNAVDIVLPTQAGGLERGNGLLIIVLQEVGRRDLQQR